MKKALKPKKEPVTSKTPIPVPLQRRKSSLSSKLQWTPSIVKKGLRPKKEVKKAPPASKKMQFLKPVPRKPSWRDERPKNTAFVASIAERFDNMELQARKVRQAALDEEKTKAKLKPAPLSMASRTPVVTKKSMPEVVTVKKVRTPLMTEAKRQTPKSTTVTKKQVPKPPIVKKTQVPKLTQPQRKISWRQERPKNTAVVASIAKRFDASELQAQKAREAALDKRAKRKLTAPSTASKIPAPKKAEKKVPSTGIAPITERFDTSEKEAIELRQAALEKQKMKAKEKADFQIRS